MKEQNCSRGNEGLELLRPLQVAKCAQDGWQVQNIRNKSVAELLETLMNDFGRATHSAFLDDSYSIYLSEKDRAAICFTVLRKVALIYGDPLCASERVGHVFEEFRLFCKQRRWRLAVFGASPNLAASTKLKSWSRMEFAVEQVFNPMQNQVLNETAGKTITRTNRKLITRRRCTFFIRSQDRVSSQTWSKSLWTSMRIGEKIGTSEISPRPILLLSTRLL